MSLTNHQDFGSCEKEVDKLAQTLTKDRHPRHRHSVFSPCLRFARSRFEARVSAFGGAARFSARARQRAEEVRQRARMRSGAPLRLGVPGPRRGVALTSRRSAGRISDKRSPRVRVAPRHAPRAERLVSERLCRFAPRLALRDMALAPGF